MADVIAGAQQIDGDTPHDDADAGNPVKVGGVANADAATAVAENDRVEHSYTLRGEARVRNARPAQLSATLASLNDEVKIEFAHRDGPTMVCWSIGGGLTGTIVFEVSMEGTNWIGTDAFNETDPDTPITTLDGASAVVGYFAHAGYQQYRLRCSAFTSGSTNARLEQSVGGAGSVRVSSGVVSAVGNIAHDTADSGNPVKIGGRARTSQITAVANDDRVDAVFTTEGALMIAGRQSDGTPNEVRVDGSGFVTVQQASSSRQVNGNVLHDLVDSGNPVKIGGFASDAITTPVSADADRVNAWFNRRGALKNVVVDDAGVSCMDGTNNAVQVNVVAGAAGGVTHTDDAAFTATTDDGVPVFGYHDDTAPPGVTDGNAGAVRMTGTRSLHTVLRDGAENERSLNISAENAAAVAGDIAHDTADSGNPVKIGGVASATLPSAVGEGDRVDQYYDLQGQARTIANGNIASDNPDGGFPVKIGGRARTSAIAAVANDDRVDQIHSTTGGLLTAGTDGGVPRDVAVNASGQLEVDIAAQQGSALDVQGDVAHDTADSGNPLSMGLNAAEFNADPPQVSTDGDRVRAIATPQGIQWILPGHPNLIHREYMTTGAQTNDPIVDTVAAGSQIIITAIEVLADEANTASVQCRVGFGTASVPAEPASGASVDGMVISHGGIAAGSGVVKNNTFIGGDGEELRITCEAPSSKLTVNLSYYISSL